MDQNLSDVIAAIQQQLTSLHEKRSEHLATIHEIDGKIAGIAKQLGLPSDQVASPNLTRLSAPVDRRISGSLPDRMLEILRDADVPHTRVSMKAALLNDPKHGDTIRKNVNTFYNAVKRYLDKGKIVEQGGYLYHPDRAPLPEGQDDPTGQHLPANVSPIRKLDL